MLTVFFMFYQFFDLPFIPIPEFPGQWRQMNDEIRNQIKAQKFKDMSLQFADVQEM